MKTDGVAGNREPSLSRFAAIADSAVGASPRPPGKVLKILHTDINVLTGDQALKHLRTITPDEPAHVSYINAHSLNIAYKVETFRAAISRCRLVLNDGIGLELAARMRGSSFPENLNGSDFTLRVLSFAATQGWRVFLYGGLPSVATDAAGRLCSMIPDLNVVGVCDGYAEQADARVITQIKAARTDVLIVALGQPRQELWLDEHLAETGCRLGIGVGAFLDFVTGRVRRAPAWMNRGGIEWVYRLTREPGRLWRRYVVGNPVFLCRAWRLRKAEALSGNTGHAHASLARS